MTLRPGSFHETTWEKVRLEVKELTPDIYQAIEKMSPDKSYKLYEVTYPYGASPLAENNFILPYENGWEPITSSKFDKRIQEELCYQPNYGLPLGIVLEGQLQLSFFERAKLALPAAIFTKGRPFAIRAALDFPNKYQATYYWNMTSGVRTVYMLASLADKRKFNVLQKEFGTNIDIPLEQLDHWTFFRSLANAPQFQTTWSSRLLLFGKKWVDTLHENTELRRVLLERFFQATTHERNSDTFDQIWEDFILTIRNKKVDRYILNMARYIFDAAIGKTLSFKIAGADEQAGPFSEIAKIICNVYELDKYAPVIVAPAIFNSETQQKAYISIKYPTVKIERTYSSKNNFLMADFREIAYVINKFVPSIKNEVLDEVPMYNMGNYNYNFFSADRDRMNDFLPAEQAFKNDNNFEYWANFGGSLVNTKNPYMRACVSISEKS
jgi:hypothetical protein